MVGFEQMSLSLQVTAVLAPVAVYFFMLGLLNSRPTPQMMGARTDFFLLNAAFAPAFCMPAILYFGGPFWVLPIVVAALLTAAVAIAGPRRGSWVLYNVSMPVTLRTVERALLAMGEGFRRDGRTLELTGRNVSIRLGCLPMLRNVSITARGELDGFHDRFQQRLGRELTAVHASASPMSWTFMLLAVGMLVAPVGLLAQRVPEMVRVITDLVK